jgi:hypothetical protein
MLNALLRTLVLGLALVAALPVFASRAQVLGYTVGESTFEEVKSSLQSRGTTPRNTGISTHAGGPMLVAPGRGLGIDGLQQILMLFDAQNRLAGALLTLNKARYDAVVSAMKEKYTLVREVRPHVGNRRAEFRAEGALITVDAPHLSFEMTIMYRTLDVEASMDRSAAAAEEKRRRVDREQF